MPRRLTAAYSDSSTVGTGWAPGRLSVLILGPGQGSEFIASSTRRPRTSVRHHEERAHGAGSRARTVRSARLLARDGRHLVSESECLAVRLSTLDD